MKIVAVELFIVHGTWASSDYLPGDRQAQALDIYPEFNARDWSRQELASPRPIEALYVEIKTDEGLSGLFGPIEAEQAFVIKEFLTPYLLGRDPLATELLHDQMLRLHRHGRSGLFMTGLSAIDCALWDLKGKAWNQPIYRLLGGPTRPAVPAYASMLGYTIEPGAAAQIALDIKSQGYTAQKWFFRFGPGDGESGKSANIALAQAVRQAVGPNYPLMFDAFMGWNVPYANELAQALSPLNITWLEEPLPPERISAFRRLKDATHLPLATGEHVYTRWQVAELLESRAVDFIQTDPDWCGGITELVKICALCSAYEVPVIAHGHSILAALHVASSQSPSVVPMVEYLLRHQANKQFFHTRIYHPENGSINLPDLPGLGLVIDEGKCESRHRFS